MPHRSTTVLISEQGKQKLRKAREEKEWIINGRSIKGLPIDDEQWLQEISQVLEYEALEAAWNSIVHQSRYEEQYKLEHIKAFCEVLGLRLADIADSENSHRALIRLSQQGRTKFLEALGAEGWWVDAQSVNPSVGARAFVQAAAQFLYHHPPYLVSEASLKRMLYQTQKHYRLKAENVAAFCHVLGLELADVIEQKCATNVTDLLELNLESNQSSFYGRITALNQFQQWLTNGHFCRLIILHGRAGVGKTALAEQLIKRVANQYDFILAIPVEAQLPYDFLSELLTELPNAPNPGETFQDSLHRLKQYLSSKRCLLVLDDWQDILRTTRESDLFHYREGYEGYNTFLREIIRTPRQVFLSQLLVISRENPISEELEIQKAPYIRSLLLENLNYDEDSEILAAEGLSGTSDELERFLEFYGNPLVLKLVAKIAREMRQGSVSEYVKGDATALIPKGVYKLISEEIKNLSVRERNLLYWLAIRRDSVSSRQLAQDTSMTVIDLDGILYTLGKRQGFLQLKNMSDDSELCSTLDRVTLKNVIAYFVEQCSGELFQAIQNQKIQGNELFVTHTFVTHSSLDEDLVLWQKRKIVRPIRDDLTRKLQTKSHFEEKIQRMFVLTQCVESIGYSQSNLLELMKVQ